MRGASCHAVTQLKTWAHIAVGPLWYFLRGAAGRRVSEGTGGGLDLGGFWRFLVALDIGPEML